MEAEDIQKIAARTGYPEKDVALALRTAKDDVAEAEKLLAPTIGLIKGCYAAKTNRLNGGLIILVDIAQKKIKRTKAIATYDSEYGQIPLDMSWEQIERKIIDAEIKQNMVPAISQDLAGEMEYTLQENIEDTLALLTANRADELSTRLRRVVCTCLGDSDVDLVCVIEKISTLTLKLHDHEIKPESEEAAAPEGAAPAESKPAEPTEAEGRNLILKTDVILSPVVGTPVTSLNPGDFILVKITDTRPQAAYIANLLHASDGTKSLPIRVPIRKIDRSESQRLVITTEFGPGVFGRTVVQEGLKIKTAQEGEAAKIEGVKLPVYQILLIVGLAGFVLCLLLVVVYYFVVLL